MSTETVRAASPTLRVAQLNVGSLLEPHWDRRRDEVVAWLERLQPDVVCLQEVWEDASNANTAAWLVEASRGVARWHWCFGGFPFPDGLWPDPSMRFGSAILSRWPIERHELIALPVDETSDDAFYRLRSELLYAHTAGLDVFSTHLVPAPAQAYHRVRQVLAIDDAIRSRHRAGTAMPPILCGDFNAEPPSDEMRFLTSHAVIDGRSTYFQDAWPIAGADGAGLTQDPHANPNYAVMNLPPKRIDYVLVGDPFRRPRGAGVIESAALAFHEPLTGIIASDHFGLVVEVRWPQRPS
jgi:endonuclease/exonuclease/phosphatase family metal-dependent hydrolase